MNTQKVDVVLDEAGDDAEQLVRGMSMVAGVAGTRSARVLESSGAYWAVRDGEVVRCGHAQEAQAILDRWVRCGLAA